MLLERIADRGQLLDQADMETECDGLAGQGQQLRKRSPMGVVVAGLDVLDQCRRLRGRIKARNVFEGHGRASLGELATLRR